MNGFYILAHDHRKLQKTLDIVNHAIEDLQLNHQSNRSNSFCNVKNLSFLDDQFYADSYGSGLLLRGVSLRFLKRYEKSHQAFDEIINMFVFLQSE